MRLGVYFEGRRVGLLERPDEDVLQVTYTYDEGWASDPDAFPVSTRMPIGGSYAPTDAYNWFLNLLPEGNGLEAVGQVLSVSKFDVMAMMATMGGDLPGALEVRPDAGGHRVAEPHYRKFSDAELEDAIKRLPERPLLVGEDGVQMSLAGAQEKLAVGKHADGRLSLPLNGAVSTHILKPAHKKLMASVQNEAFCLTLASLAGLSAAEVTTGRAGETEYLLVSRYDRVYLGGGVRRIHQEDLCQAMGHPPHRKYEWNRETAQRGPTLVQCFKALDVTSAPAASRTAFFDAVLFNILVDNVDAHAKNYSLLIGAGGQVTLAPLYDVMCGNIYESVTRNLAMKVAGRNRGGHIRAKDWDMLSTEVGLSPSAIRRRVRKMATSLPGHLKAAKDAIPASPGQAAVVGQICDCVRDRCARMLANLKNGVLEVEEQY